MRAVVLAAGLTACAFQHGVGPGDPARDASDGDASGAVVDASGIDAALCGWSYVPSNFDVCVLPPPASLVVNGNMMLDTAMTSLPKLTVMQGDNTSITVLHLSTLTVEASATLTLNGTGVVLAVDGPVNIAGTIVAAGGSDLAAHCDNARGRSGGDLISSSADFGAGGGGGASAADNGGVGSKGDGLLGGGAGARGAQVGASTLTPLRAGCRGGNGGKYGLFGASPAGGRGGGAVQISSNMAIAVSGFIDAAGSRWCGRQ